MRSFVQNEHGSLSLEGAMTMPFFLLFIFFLATMIRIGVAEIALNHAVSETAEGIATHVYPAALLSNKIQPTIDTFIKDKTNQRLNLQETKDLLTKGLTIAGISPRKIMSSLTAKALTPIVRSKFQESAGTTFFNKKDVKVVKVNFDGGLSGGAIGIVAQYKMDLFLPFVHKSIVLKRRAYERFWSG